MQLALAHATTLEATAGNGAFSRLQPGMQLAIDSTSLGSFKVCPRRYQYEIVLGYQSARPSVDLDFGIWYHGALERYDHARFASASHDDSLDVALGWLLSQTWNSQLARPWSSLDPNKNRLTLIRTVVDYLDRFGENDSLETIQLANGKPAVELTFRFFSGLHTGAGEEVAFCGHLDRLVRFGGEVWVVDRKTTKHTIGPDWFRQFAPHNQFSLYLLAAQVAFHEPAKGLIVDGAQVAVGWTRFERAPILRDSSQLEEWHRDAGWQIRQMEACAVADYWPQNDQSCDRYGGCPFRGVCSKPPHSREQWLNGPEYRKRVWDPTVVRGDI